MNENKLFDYYNDSEKTQGFEALYEKLQDTVRHAETSLKHSLRPYQKQALQRFFHYETQYENKCGNNHLLFEMATGTGKTLIMAALLPYFYKRGYTIFVFFVNSKAIVEKTKQNFCDSASSKYVFDNSLTINGARVEIQAVENLHEAHSSCINILFTTIQGLHEQVHTVKENATTLEDFAEHKVVLLADEAHHNNTSTKEGLRLKYSWEDTVQKIYTQHAENYLLEFTATAGLDTVSLQEKYRNKVLISYNLKNFCKNGYSKHIHLALTKTQTLEEKFLTAVITNQYRQEIAAKHGLTFKPVLLFISQYIRESKEAEEEFHTLIEHIEEKHIDSLFSLIQGYKNIPLYRDIHAFFTSSDFSHSFLAKRLRGNFSKDKTINVNDDKDLMRMQMLLHTLEDEHNKVRVIFAVNKLNEGWDVLNLYDIVKLYETRTTKDKPSTTQEIQLIGRGARLFPFSIEEGQEKYMRKYDKNSDHPLSILEQLHFHTPDGSAFIQQLRKDLEKEGLNDRKMKECEIRLKDSFKDSHLYQKGYMYTNEKVKKKRKNILQDDLFGSIDTKSLDDIKGKYHIDVSLDIIDIDEKKKIQDFEYTKELPFSLADIPDRIFLKAVSRNKHCCFHSVESKLDLNTILDIKTRFKANTLIILYPQQYTKAQVKTPRALLKTCEDLLTKLANRIYDEWTEYAGSTKLVSKPIKKVFTDKKVLMNNDDEMCVCESIPYFAQEQVKVNETEKQCITDLLNLLENSNIPVKWLIRNERHFTLYNFEDGKGFEPDFLLMLENEENTVYQVFVEVKGEHLQEYDSWKETLMQDFESLQTDNTLYRLKSVPFYTSEGKDKFLPTLKKHVADLSSSMF